MKKNIFKKIAIPILFIIPMGLIIGFSNSWFFYPTISIAGSSSMEPLVSSFGNAYTNIADISVVAGGSGGGINSVVLSQKNIGNASTNPYHNVEKANIKVQGWDKNTWTEKKIKTTTIAWDAIAIVYKSNNNDLIINKENINNLYEVFAGNEPKKLSFLNKNISPDNDFLIRPYARIGGSKASGTATSFLTESGFSNTKDLNVGFKNQLENGSYGNYTTQTPESNIESWTRIKSDNIMGSMIYLSLGFVRKNITEINNSGFKVAKYMNENETTTSIDPVNKVDAIFDSKHYAWFSPLNCIFSIEQGSKYIYDFIWWILTSNEAKLIIEEYGFNSLSTDQKKSMISNKFTNSNFNFDNFFNSYSSDSSLEGERKLNSQQNWKWYGALK